MIVEVGRPFLAQLVDAPDGLVGTITSEIYDADGVTIEPPSTELMEISPGTYTCAFKIDVLGDYTIRWVIDDIEVEEALRVTNRIPTADDVAALLYARTRTDAGLEGHFTDDTRPTLEQVERFCREGADDVVARVRYYPVTGEPLDAARRLAAKYAAMRVELSLSPEATNDVDSAYSQLRDEYEAGIVDLRARLTPASALRLQ